MKTVNVEFAQANAEQMGDLLKTNFAARSVYVTADGVQSQLQQEAEIYCSASHSISLPGSAWVARYVHELDARAEEVKLVGVQWVDFAAALRRQGWIRFQLELWPVEKATVIGDAVVVKLGERL